MNETSERHRNRFMADLTQAMRSTAETARQGAIDQCETDAKSYEEQLLAGSDHQTVSLRNAAEADVSSINDWAASEMERIRVETERRIARRRELLEQELQDHAASTQVEIAGVRKQVSDYEAQVSAFFERLLQESDPTVFAAMAAQMPDPPLFGGVDQGGVAPDLPGQPQETTQSGVEASPEGSATVEEPAVEEPAVEEPAVEEPAVEEPAVEEPAIEEPAVEGPVVEGPVVEEPVAEEPVVEAVDESALVGGREAPLKTTAIQSTQVVVVGLVSVVSVATFKRQLGRLAGVKNVGVSSGPDGEFIFAVSHSSDTSLGSLIPTLPGFQARVMNEREGMLNVSAHDPEAEG